MVEPNLDREFMTWFAGFWEGEGSTSTYVNRATGQIIQDFSVSQTGERGRRILTHIKEKLGMGHICFSPARGNHQVSWRWHVRKRSDVIKMIKAILPYLKFRQKEVEGCLIDLESYPPARESFPWVDEEDKLLREAYSKYRGKTKELCKLFPKRTLKSIWKRAMSLGLSLRKNPPWSSEEDKELSQLKREGLSHKKIGNLLGRPTNAITARWYLVRHKK